MFDLATRLQPDAHSLGALAGVPFDLRLTPPEPPRSYPFTTLVNSGAVQVAGAEALATYALALEGGLATQVTLSLFTDRRAGPDDALPAGQSDRRGWVGDEFMPQPTGADPWGSALWLIYTGKATGNVLELARFAAKEALAWLLRDGIAGRVDVAAQWVQGTGQQLQRLAIRPTIWQPDRVRPVYDVLWGTSIQRWAD